MLINALMNTAIDSGLSTVYSPTAALAMIHTDTQRNVGRDLFARVYDRAIQKHLEVQQQDGWWHIDVAANRDRVVMLNKSLTVKSRERTICLCHDIELGLGHRDEDPSLASTADRLGEASLDRMLALEQEAGVTATYNIVGCLWSQLEPRISAAGHATGFHSYDHRLPASDLFSQLRRQLRFGMPVSDQLERCRSVDYRIKGYRPPQSRIGKDLCDASLSFHGFEWLASSAFSLGIDEPHLKNGIVKIPILFDDYGLYRDGQDFKEWQAVALQRIRNSSFVAFSLHDCYAHLWLPHYQAFLCELRQLGRLCTLDQVAAETTLAQARWI